jgi:methylaspartate ammonia-lyase
MLNARNVHIHDSTVWNQDDSFDVKDNSENILIERINARCACAFAFASSAVYLIVDVMCRFVVDVVRAATSARCHLRSGVGLTIGSISSTVRNVTFRDAYMHHTYKVGLITHTATR